MALSPLPLRIATVDRDTRFLKALARCLEPLDGTLLVHSGPVIGEKLIAGRPHAVLVDILHLGPRWEDWLVRHPLRVPHLGVMVCTERSTVEQRVRTLHMGVDDWIAKPCDPQEVVARLQAIVRGYRLRTIVEDFDIRSGGELELRPDLFAAFAAGRPVGLTRREFEVLLCLARYKGRAIERERLYREVWGYEMAMGSRSLDTIVRKLRGKLKVASPGWLYVHTHRGVGYRFEARRTPRAGSRIVQVRRS
ncbi:MAG TPA: response regulator transcription factor [Solirubrobacteraceae bacterium]|jgi:DNA-binding response OmpR family regulator|nr:response regulator transcription factor [Solirubrobacteraceae bacterium]